jgi:hypothetical protein
MSLGAPAASSQSPLGTPPTPGSVRQIRLSLPEKDWSPTPIELVRGGVFFQANVNGRTVWAVLDNGADRTAIDRGLVRELGLVDRPGSNDASTPMGPLKSTLVDGVSVEVPRQIAFRDTLVGLDLSSLSDKIGRRIGLVLGNEILANLAYYIDTKNMKLYLRQSGKIIPNKAVTRTPIVQGRLVDVRINGSPYRLEIDLGFNGTVSLSDRAWRRVVAPNNLAGSSRTFDAGGRENATMLSQPVRFDMAGITAMVPVSTQYADRFGADRFVGMGLFRHFNTLIDGPQGSLLLIPDVAGQTSYRFDYSY